jgi:hypothetical protein
MHNFFTDASITKEAGAVFARRDLCGVCRVTGNFTAMAAGVGNFQEFWIWKKRI